MASPACPVVLCADDFGLTEGVSRGILELAFIGRLSATSAMTNCAAWERIGPELRPFEGRIGIGLHLNLTTGAPLGPMPELAPGGGLPRNAEVVARALTRRLPLAEVAGEIERQLDRFEAVLGRGPDFVDGHQHVHVLPGIRSALLGVLKAHGLTGIWLRDPGDRLSAIAGRRTSVAKALLVHGFASGFGDFARRSGFDTNEGFSGFSAFDQTNEGEMHRLFEQAFSMLGPRHVAMCHPGHPDEALRALDTVVESRARELAYLASERFGELLRRRGVRLASRPEPRVPN